MLVLLVLSEVLAASTWLVSENPARQAEGNACRFGEVYSREGWKIPGGRGAAPKGSRAALQSFPEVFVTQLRPGKLDLTLPMFQCSRDIQGRLSFRAKPVAVLELWRFDYHGNPFAFGAKYEPQTTDAKGTNPRRSLEFVSVFFYDPDGSGHYSIMKYPTSPSFFSSIEVPPWVMSRPSK